MHYFKFPKEAKNAPAIYPDIRATTLIRNDNPIFEKSIEKTAHKYPICGINHEHFLCA